MPIRSVRDIVNGYNCQMPLAEAATISADWYVEPAIFALERNAVFLPSWQMIGRAEQVSQPGRYLSGESAGERVVVVRGNDGVLRGFINVCRHHAAAVVTDLEGRAASLRCPYHGWTYNLAGELQGTPDFAGIRNFDCKLNGLVAVDIALWGGWVFVRVERGGAAVDAFFGAGLRERVEKLNLENFHWFERRRYMVNCNWKVYVDNYLDGGYHVPHLHRGLCSALDFRGYRIENGERFCLQTCPMAAGSRNPAIAALRKGADALYCWVYPNFMINCYEEVMDTNFVYPLAVDRTEVVFDYYFADVSARAREENLASIALSERIQEEDAAICMSVQRGLQSRYYSAGRLSPQREAGEHLFHCLLYADLKKAIDHNQVG